MIDVLIGFAVGFLIGGFAGVVLTAIVAISRDEE